MAKKDVEFIRFNQHAIPWNTAFRTPRGMVGQKITNMTKTAGIVARVEAPHPGSIPMNRTGINYSTGELAAGIRTNVAVVRKEVEGRVIALPEHSFYLHEGTPPHVIKARTKPKLVFFWHKVGRVVKFDKVNHPGTRANQFLVRALVRVMRRFV